MRTRKSVPTAPGANRAHRGRLAPSRDRHDPEVTAPKTKQEENPPPAAALDLASRQNWRARQMKQLPAEIESELADVVAATGCELIHAEWKGGALQVFIDRIPSGVSLADCEHVAKLTSALLDVLDFGNSRYLLEVSSPGLDRQLYRPRDYERFLGRLVRVSYETPPAGAERSARPLARPTRPGGQKPSRRTVVARLAEFRRPAVAVDPAHTPAPPATSVTTAATTPTIPTTPTAGPPIAGSPAGAGAAAPGPRGVPSAGEVTLIDDHTGERLTLKLEAIRLARLEVEL